MKGNELFHVILVQLLSKENPILKFTLTVFMKESDLINVVFALHHFQIKET